MLANLQIFNKKENILIAYKLSVDSLFILLIVFILAMIAEGALPGIIASHIGLYKISISIILNVLITSLLMRLAGIATHHVTHKKTAWALLLILGLLIFNSLLQLNILLALLLSAMTFVTTYFMLKMFREE